MNKKSIRRWVFNLVFFAAIMALTVWSVLKDQDPAATMSAVRRMKWPYLAASVALSVLFVAGEGTMICYLLRGIGERTTLPRCISYSFIGFLFSGITPSATGGQPMQLYYMKRHGNTLGASTVVLMTVATIYKFVLVVLGAGIAVFWNAPLKAYLKGYYGLYFLGLSLNAAVTAVLLLVMFSPGVIRALFYRAQRLLVRLRLWKEKEERNVKMERFLSNYQGTVAFLKSHRRMLQMTVAGTFLQRFCVFLLTYVVYRGLGFSGTAMPDIVLAQASVYIAVDMLPIPGAQGITEAMYRCVFAGVFRGSALVASMCITRGVSFYLMLVAGFIVFCATNRQNASKSACE